MTPPHDLGRRRRHPDPNPRRPFATPESRYVGPVLSPPCHPPRDEWEAEIRAAVETLPTRTREVAWLRLHNQLSTPQIAKLLDIEPATVERHMRRIVAAVKAQVLELQW